ncbi:MAG: glycosyltransferase involved in cell wall biosynthesis [Arenicella sp.]|jgi:glycosyltransferase involved in cell wall biosynthesis
MLSIVIPIYNEEENIPTLYARLISASPLWEEEFEVIFVDDGSFDSSFEMLHALAQKDSRIKIIKLSRNFGHQPAISAGIQKAKGDAVIIMDGDLQDPPEELPRFLEKWREGYHVVYAIRTKRKENIFKRFAYSSFYRFLGIISEIEIPLDSGDFCVMDKKVVKALNHDLPEKIRFVRGLRAYAGFKQVGVKYERAERAAGEVKYTFRKLMKLALDGLFDFSTFPLRLASYLGIFIAFMSLVVGVFFVFQRIFDFKILGYSPADVPGLASLAIGIFFIGGVTLLVLGIIGEYLGRIYFEVKKRPNHIIEEFYDYSGEERK